MASLVFPQLSSGAQVQYPLRKQRAIQAVLNAFADGTMIASNINGNTQRVWELAYTELTAADQAALQNHFVACRGALLPFIFIDPTGNMLSNSAALTATSWLKDPLLSVVAGAPDPMGGNTGFTVVNAGAQAQTLTQSVAAPAGFQYCFSLYAASPVASSINLASAGPLASQSQTFEVSTGWQRLVNTAQLSDGSIGFSVSISIPPAQTVVLWGPQLEPQISPSRYRATAAAGGVYQNAHLLGDTLTFESDAPGLFSTLIRIETT